MKQVEKYRCLGTAKHWGFVELFDFDLTTFDLVTISVYARCVAANVYYTWSELGKKSQIFIFRLSIEMYNK